MRTSTLEVSMARNVYYPHLIVIGEVQRGQATCPESHSKKWSHQTSPVLISVSHRVRRDTGDWTSLCPLTPLKVSQTHPSSSTLLFLSPTPTPCFFSLDPAACGTLAPQPRTEPMSPVVEVQGLNPRTTGAVPTLLLLIMPSLLSL